MELTILFLVTTGILNGGMGVIKHRQSRFVFLSPWWLGIDDHSWKHRNFFTKYVFSFISNGWHTLKSARVVTFICAAFFYESVWTALFPQTLPGYALFFDVVIYYAFTGAAFELGYNFVWDKPFWLRVEFKVIEHFKGVRFLFDGSYEPEINANGRRAYSIIMKQQISDDYLKKYHRTNLKYNYKNKLKE